MKLKLFWPAITWFIFSTVLLLIPGDQLPKGPYFIFPLFDKIVHLLIFFLLTILFSAPLRHAQLPANKKTPLFTGIALFISFYGILIEFIQKHFIPFRSFDTMDIIFDVAGSFLGLMVSINFYQKK